LGTNEYINKIIQGDCLEQLKKLDDNSIDCIMTSPPYWALRNYNVEGQLGLEPNFNDYINKLCDIFDEIKRVLKPTGTCWINIGDTYSGNRNGNTNYNEGFNQRWEGSPNKIQKQSEMGKSGVIRKMDIEKSLCQIPSRFAIEMTNRGWILRNEIIWYKPNCMPSSVRDRFTVDFEKLFFFTKSKKYYFETQYEPNVTEIKKDIKWKGNQERSYVYGKSISDKNTLGSAKNEQGRNKRCVWRITTKPYKEAHFATYPETLCETPIKAGCPEFICKRCGFIKEKIIECKGIPRDRTKGKLRNIGQQDGFGSIGGKDLYEWKQENPNIFKGYSTCNCNEGFESGIVLDPFFGSGTTGLVALKQNKKFIGIELNSEYVNMAKVRLKPYLEQRKILEDKKEEKI